MRDAPLVSILTPVYNGADYLSECIRSVLSQTYDNWQYTIIDNASTDATPDIADDFSRRDDRIEHLRFEHFVDITANHNRAFANISLESTYCKLVEADDWLYPHCLEAMVAAASHSDRIAIVSSYQLWERRVHLFGLPYTTTSISGRAVLRSTLLGSFNVTGGPTATLLRSDCVRARGSQFYQNGLQHEDTEAALWLLSQYDFAFIHQILTFARYQPQARTRWSSNMNTHTPEDIIFLLRYGPMSMKESEYRTRLRALLRNYLLWHLRQLPRISRLRDRRFFDLHSSKRLQILEESDGDTEVRLAMDALSALLWRGLRNSAFRSSRL